MHHTSPEKCSLPKRSIRRPRYGTKAAAETLAIVASRERTAGSRFREPQNRAQQMPKENDKPQQLLRLKNNKKRALQPLARNWRKSIEPGSMRRDFPRKLASEFTQILARPQIRYADLSG